MISNPATKMKGVNFFVIVCCYLHLVRLSNSARILGIFNFEMLSHFRFHEVMMKSLASAGHQVTIVGPFELQHPHENITVVNSNVKKFKNDENPIKVFAKANLPFLQAMVQYLEMYDQNCRYIISLIQEKNLINVDVMFIELMSMNQCFIPLAKQMEIPVIGTLSFRSYINLDLAVGHIRNPSVVPTELFYVNVKMSFYERLVNLFNEIFLIRIARFLEDKKIGKLFEDLFAGKYSENYSLVFINNHASLQQIALAPNVVQIGGINIKSAKLTSLPQEFQTFIDGAKYGVILLSLGTLVSSDAADPHLTSILRNTFAKIPQRVIWKYNGTMARVSDNVLLSPWIPQKEILAHKNVVALVSHCGISSTYEAIYFSKPMILLPIFAEQPSNAALLKYLGVGVHLKVQELTEEKLLEAIKEVISNKKYHSNMAQLSRRFKDEPKSPEELVVQWTEYVLRHKGAPFLRSVTADIAWYQYILLDVFAFVAIVSVFAIAFVYLLTKYIMFLTFRFFRRDIILIEKKKL